MKKLSKKGNINALQAFVMGIGSIAVVLAIVLYVLTELQSNVKGDAVAGCGLNSTGGTVGDTTYACNAAYNSTGSLVTKLGTAPTWIGLLIVVTFAVAVMGYFYLKG